MTASPAAAERLRPLQVTLLAILAVTLAGSCWLTDGPLATIEGAKDWRQESPLRALVTVLNLNYTQTTAQGVDIKALVWGAGTALALLAGAIALAFRSPTSETPDELERQERDPSPSVFGGATPLARRQISPLAAAQWMMAGYLAWSFVSLAWSTAPELAWGGSWVLAGGVLWALALGRGLNRTAGGIGALILLAVCVGTALLAAAYYSERNPPRRASYPIGNPLFLAACLIPGFTIAAALIASATRHVAHRAIGRAVTLLLVGIGSLAALAWTLSLTSSRSALVGLGAGFAAMVLAVVPRKARWPIAALLLVLVGFAGQWTWTRWNEPSNTGRDATLRLRLHAWAYAADLIAQAPFLGHGQGGFTRFGDTQAAADVLADPEALEARLDHAHNEWLEVWTDLGLVGFLLAAGSIVCTLLAVWRRMEQPDAGPHRWLLIAVFGGLVALAVEESADPGLRVAGLPAVFYSVIGLSWALCRTSTVVGRPVPRSRAWIRPWAAMALVVSATWLLAVSVGDFRAARAYFDVAAAVNSGNFDDAGALAERAVARRLTPQRRLEALERLCSTHVYIAREFQISSLQRAHRARQESPPDSRLLAVAGTDRQASEAHMEQARQALRTLLRYSPNYWDAGWLEYRLYELRNVFAGVDGDAATVASASQAAAEALRRELRRRPFDATIATAYARVVGDDVPLAERLEWISRPLRYGPISPAHTEVLAALISEAGFDAEFAPLHDQVTAVAESRASIPFAAEILRLAAYIHFLRDHPAAALETGRWALERYEAFTPPALLAMATCLAELADYQLFTDPAQWSAALAFAERSLATTPPSTPGRELARFVRERAVSYLLAGDDEGAARRAVRELDSRLNDQRIERALARHYATLCKDLMRHARTRLPEAFGRWVDRALALDETNELAWRLAAQRAFDAQDFSRSAECLRRALHLGADAEIVAAFVRQALDRHPDDSNFQTLMNDLSQAVRPPPAPAPESDRTGT